MARKPPTIADRLAAVGATATGALSLFETAASTLETAAAQALDLHDETTAEIERLKGAQAKAAELHEKHSTAAEKIRALIGG